MVQDPESIPGIIYFLRTMDPEIIPGVYFLKTEDPEIIPGIYFLKTMDPETIPRHILSYDTGS